MSFATWKKEAAFTTTLLRRRPFSCLIQVNRLLLLELPTQA